MQELIDRQAALKKMCETCGYCDRCEKAMRSTHPDFVADKCNNYKFLAELPTIEPEVRRGRWIPITNDDFGFASKFKCTYCRDIIRLNVPITKCNYKYCPNCGAQIDLRTPTEVQLDMADSVMMGEVAE